MNDLEELKNKAVLGLLIFTSLALLVMCSTRKPDTSAILEERDCVIILKGK